MELAWILAIAFCIFEPWSVRAKCRRTGCYNHHGEYSARCPQ